MGLVLVSLRRDLSANAAGHMIFPRAQLLSFVVPLLVLVVSRKVGLYLPIFLSVLAARFFRILVVVIFFHVLFIFFF